MKKLPPSASLQARLVAVNAAISEQEDAIDAAPKGSPIRKAAKRQIRVLKRRRKKLRKDRFKMKGATAIIKYEVIPVLVAAGVPITSRKRLATFGNPSSDHWLGNRDADAADGGTFSNNNELGNQVVNALRNTKGSRMSGFVEFEITRSHTGSEETYRIQVITEPHGTGPHIHNGCKRVSA
jgi:hypothetical protein